MLKQFDKNTLVYGLLAIISSLLFVMSLFLHMDKSAQKHAHSLLIEQLKQGSASVVVNSQFLLTDKPALQRVKAHQGKNIADFQKLYSGSIKEGLAPIDKLVSGSVTPLKDTFDKFSKVTAELLHSRTNIDRTREERETFFQTIGVLISKSEGIVAGLSGLNPTQSQLSAAYDTLITLQQYQIHLIEGFTGSRAIAELDIDGVRSNLESLSTNAGAPKSSTIRRSSANLLASTEEFFQKTQTLNEYSEQQRSLDSKIDNLKQIQLSLMNLLAETQPQLTQAHALLLYLVYGFSLIALVFTALTAFQIGKRQQKAPLNTTTISPAPGPEAEKTSQTELARFKTEKNLLMNDIKPLADGILYIKADEHLSAAGDVARCLNQSRESLARRISSIQANALEVQKSMHEQRNGDAKDHEKPLFQFNSTPIEDLTLKANAELDGLQRKLKQLNHPDKEELKSIMIRALRAERILDELRVRIRKGWAEELVEQVNPHTETDSRMEQADKLSRLVHQMVDNLNEFKLEAPNTRSRR